MIAREILKVLDSEWVQAKKDEDGNETWGYELKEGAPDDVKEAFRKYQEASDLDDELHGYK